MRLLLLKVPFLGGRLTSTVLVRDDLITSRGSSTISGSSYSLFLWVKLADDWVPIWAGAVIFGSWLSRGPLSRISVSEVLSAISWSYYWSRVVVSSWTGVSRDLSIFSSLTGRLSSWTNSVTTMSGSFSTSVSTIGELFPSSSILSSTFSGIAESLTIWVLGTSIFLILIVYSLLSLAKGGFFVS